MRIQTPIRMKYAYGAESSGICVKFMPYQPAIRESGKKIVETTVRIRIVSF